MANLRQCSEAVKNSQQGQKKELPASLDHGIVEYQGDPRKGVHQLYALADDIASVMDEDTKVKDSCSAVLSSVLMDMTMVKELMGRAGSVGRGASTVHFNDPVVMVD
eukprot:GHVU01190935.1.p3 GENE.GHVU01190935.1~~GHVU01190935.1.p3  ORF type:complete len:107 (+),score=13.00 GHVU01190935.1:4966-5286(+)